MKRMTYASMPPVPIKERRWPTAQLTQSPRWCAVDLRDGNQALPNPMTPQQKRKYFSLLVDIGFKEIEIGFPSASSDDFNFCRDLIADNAIPDDVTISVLTQAREHLIDKTMEALRGAKKAVVHFYIATSRLHMEFVLGANREQMMATAVKCTRQIREMAQAMPDSHVGLQFSPEEFTDSDLDFTHDICNAVVETWNPAAEEKVILNLPQTVERRWPNHYADMIEEFIRRNPHPDKTIISVHNHNDMGCAVAAAMQTLLAGAERVEGTLFGHGERTGNVDLMTLALNLEYLGIDTGLKFHDLPRISELVEEVTDIPIHPRHPYAGELVFTAFSGSHQDAIHKGLSRKDELCQEFNGWKIPYLHVDPRSLGRIYERYIRINSQSGKGGVAHIMEIDHHVKLPRWVQIDFAHHVQMQADKTAKEISSDDMWQIFCQTYMDHKQPLDLINYWPRPAEADPSTIESEVHLNYRNKKHILRSQGNGPISAFVHALKKITELPEFVLQDYAEETMGHTAEAEAICFIKIEFPIAGSCRIGVGIGNNIDQAAIMAVIAGLNAYLSKC
jgi:2-isopropylmalate synthase